MPTLLVCSIFRNIFLLSNVLLSNNNTEFYAYFTLDYTTFQDTFLAILHICARKLLQILINSLETEQGHKAILLSCPLC